MNKINSIEITDEFIPKIEGLEKKEQVRKVTSQETILSKDQLDKT